jgi:hypothetical protein
MSKEYFCEYAEAPKVGESIRRDGQTYTLVKTAPHVRQDGFPTTLLTWQSKCMTCGGPFVVVTGLATAAVNRRCTVHKSAGKPTTKAAAIRKRNGFRMASHPQNVGGL